MARITTTPTRSGAGFTVRVDGKAVAWIDGHGGSTVGRAYRAVLNGKPVPDEVTAAIEKARAKVRKEA